MKDKKLNLNPKRLITFERRILNQMKKNIREARWDGEYDYVIWLENRLEWNKKILKKKIAKMK